MKKLSILLLTLLLTACQTPPPSDEPIKIGVILPLSGNSANIGNSILNGINLAVDEFAPNYQINGQPLELIFEDNQFKTQQSVTAAKKLTSVDQVNAIFGPFGPDHTLAISSSVTKDFPNLPIMAFSNCSSSFDPFPNVFCNIPDPFTQGQFAAEKIKKADVTRLALILEIGDFADQVRAGITSELSGSDIEIVYDQEIPSDENNFISYVTKIKESNADGIYYILWPGKPSAFSKKLADFQINNLPVFATIVLDENEIALANGTLANQQIIATYPASDWFIEKIETKYPDQKADLYAQSGFDSMSALLIALSKNLQNPISELKGMKLKNPATKGFAFDKKGTVNNMPLALFEVQDNHFVLSSQN